MKNKKNEVNNNKKIKNKKCHSGLKKTEWQISRTQWLNPSKGEGQSVRSWHRIWTLNLAILVNNVNNYTNKQVGEGPYEYFPRNFRTTFLWPWPWQKVKVIGANERSWCCVPILQVWYKYLIWCLSYSPLNFFHSFEIAYLKE